MRIMALDYGRKRIGIAFSDPLFLTAQPHGYLENNSQFYAKLKALMSEKEVGEVVIGLPHSMSGNPSEMTKEVEKFGEALSKEVGLTVHFMDERLTSWEAERMLIEADVSRQKRKEVKDQLAAAVILQGYLQTRGAPKP